MRCDFQNVTDILLRNMGSSTAIYYNNLLNILFGSYLAETHLYEFDRPTAAKLHKGTIRVAPEMSEFYLNADRTILCRDIKEILQYIFDKLNTYKELYELIQFDDTLSVPMRRDILGRVSNKYIDDTSLINLIYEATYIAVTRQYTKDDNGYIAMAYSNPLQPLNDVLFANSEYVAPCRHFCGRDEELDELHSLVQDNSTVIITGTAGIGKSELVRAYAQKHKSEYAHFGYYFYKDSLKTIIANVLNNPVADSETCYRNNLELLSTLGKNVLLIIDNFNATVEDDECFYDLLDLNCKVIFTSHMKYDDLCIYELKEFRSVDLALELIRKFYSYQDSEKNDLIKIIFYFGIHTFCIELCARLMSKGLYTPKMLIRKLSSGGFKSIAERFSATKDKHPKKKTYYDHIKDLFELIGLPERHKNILQMMIVSPYCGVRKDFIAKMMNLRNMVIIEDLIEVGLIYEFENGTVTLQTVIRTLVKSELKPDTENCAPLIESIRVVCVNEALDMEIDSEKMHDIISFAITDIDFKVSDDYVPFLHDCYKFSERFGISYYTGFLIVQESGLHHSSDAKQTTLYLSDAASFEMLRGNQDKALEFQQKAVKRSRDCNDILLQANTLSTYGYYLNLADQKVEALKAIQLGLALFDRLDGDGIFYFDRYRAIINYADLLFSIGNTDEAIKQVSSAEKSLKEMDLQDTEVYADCVYSLGLYHLCLGNAKSAGNELYDAFRIFIKLYGNQSDFVHTRAAELRYYIEMANTNIMEYEPLKQLLGE